jgi:hypothetical protein
MYTMFAVSVYFWIQIKVFNIFLQRYGQNLIEICTHLAPKWQI